MAVVRCIGTHKDSSANPYMQFTARYTFYKGKSYARTEVVLRNANFTNATDSGGNTFNTAFKGVESYELRLELNGSVMTGTLDAKMTADSTACTSGICADTLNGTSDTASIYQARPANVNLQMAQQADCSSTCANMYTTDMGYYVRKNSTTLAQSTDGLRHMKSMWLDLATAGGAGAQIGIPLGAAMYPKGLSVDALDLRIGLWPAANSKAVYIPWPSWDIHEAWINFHASAPLSLSNDFLRAQHPLTGRTTLAHYNSTGALLYPLGDLTAQESWLQSTYNAATCKTGSGCANGEKPLLNAAYQVPDLGTESATWPIQAYRHLYWPDSGPTNQADRRLEKLMRFLQAGHTGRYIDAQFHLVQSAMKAWPHSDDTTSAGSTVNNFTWRSQSAPKDSFGAPAFACSGVYPGDSCSTIINSSRAFVSWMGHGEINHNHWHGILPYYFLSGREVIKEALMSWKNWFLASSTAQSGAGNGPDTARAVAAQVRGAALFGEFLTSIGDSDGAPVLANAVSIFTSHMQPDSCTCVQWSGAWEVDGTPQPTCVQSSPSGCTMPQPEPTGPPASDPPGISRIRGLMTSTGGRGGGRCGNSPSRQYRGIGMYMLGNIAGSLWDLARIKGPSWQYYNQARDLAYGVAQYGLLEHFSDDGGAYMYSNNGRTGANNLYNGWRYSWPIDVPLPCPSGTAYVAGANTDFGGTGPFYDVLHIPNTGHYPHALYDIFYVIQQTNGTLSADELRKLKITVSTQRWLGGQVQADLTGFALNAVVRGILNPPSATLKDIPFTMQDLGSGAYRLTFICPTGCGGLRIKWSPKVIAPSTGLLQYNVNTQSFGFDPATYMTWFGATTVTEPTPTPGIEQSVDVSTGTAGLAATNFSVKAVTGEVVVLPQGPSGASSGAARRSGASRTAY
jgi:hypothetical protein